jgi:hypothetical protein
MSNSLTWYNFGASWPASMPASSSTTISTSLTNLQVTAVLDDGVAGGNVIVVINQQNNDNSATCYFLQTAKVNFTTAISLSMDTAPRRDSLDKNSLGYAQGSLFAYDTSSSSFVRIDPTTGGIQGSFFVGSDPSETRFAYRAGGGSFYGFDTKSRVLTKYTAWW